MAVLQRDLFAGLVDDAALFPPGNAPMDKALTEHARHRHSSYADLVGPFLCPASRLPELRGQLGDDDRLSLSVVLDVAADAVRPALDDIAAEPRLQLVLVEGRLSALAESAEGVGATVAERGAAGFLEVDRASVADGLDAVRGSAWSAAKFRTGGTTADAFPDEGELAAFLVAAASADVCFKLTAGLHHAVRTTSAEGFEQHGVLNVLVATHQAKRGAAPDDVAATLAHREPEPLVTALRALDPADVADVRRAFRSFGCCGVTDPLDDLSDLGLLEMR